MRIKDAGLFFIALAGCTIAPIDAYKSLPPQGNVALAKSVEYIDHNTSEIIFEVQVLVLNTFYQGFDNDYLESANFQFTGNGTYTIDSFSGARAENSSGGSSLIFLIDQSDSFETIDPFNTRSPAIGKFFRDMNPPNDFTAGGFAMQGKLLTEPLELYSTNLGNEWKEQTTYVFGLTKRTGGSNAARDAADQAIELLMANPAPRGKDVILLVHGEDNSSTTTIDDLTGKGQSEGIKIHVIALGSGYDIDDFARLCAETGGLFAVCSTDRQLVKVFSELERILYHDSFSYKMRIRFDPSEGVPQPGSSYLHTIRIQDNFIQEEYNPVYVNVTVPF
jgi:hypothetical protein